MDYTQEQLKKAFEKVQDSEHWKNPIDAYCRLEDKGIIAKAIAHFTGTEAHFDATFAKGWLRVQADGYRLGPAGDH